MRRERSEADVTRFSDAAWYNPQATEQLRVCIVGAGGIGSWTALFIARLGLFKEIEIVDFDYVDHVNYAGQFFKKKDLGRYKAEVVKDEVLELTGVQLKTNFNEIRELNVPTADIYILALDNLTTRRVVAEHFKKSNALVMIDGRLLAEQFEILFVTKQNIDEYIATKLPEEASIEDAPCSFRQTSHVAAMIGTMITSVLTNYIANVVSGMNIRKVPYKTTFFVPTLTIKK